MAKEVNRETISAIDWEHWTFTEDAVLTFMEENESLLLIHKKRGLGKGKINAPGGRIDPGETRYDAAVRECIEEVGLEPANLIEVGELQFIFVDGYSLRGYLFFSRNFSGTMIETDEALPFWCKKNAIPYAEMWADDILWLPRVLAGEKILGRFCFDDDKMLDHAVIGTGMWEYSE